MSPSGGGKGRKRTVHRSRSGTKLYAVRDSKGRFVDIQTYKRAHASDVKRKSKAEVARKKSKATRKAKPSRKASVTRRAKVTKKTKAKKK